VDIGWHQTLLVLTVGVLFQTMEAWISGAIESPIASPIWGRMNGARRITTKNRPWDRNAIDKRIIREVREGTGRIINGEQEVGGYPTMKETRSRFDPEEWDTVTMERKENDSMGKSMR